jgi:hypothetical protein
LGARALLLDALDFFVEYSTLREIQLPPPRQSPWRDDEAVATDKPPARGDPLLAYATPDRRRARG